MLKSRVFLPINCTGIYLMIDAITSLMSYAMTRNDAAMSLAKSRMEAEAAVAQVIMEAAENIESMQPGHIGSNIDIYV